MSLKAVLILANSADPDEMQHSADPDEMQHSADPDKMQHYAAFHLIMLCLPICCISSGFALFAKVFV